MGSGSKESKWGYREMPYPVSTQRRRPNAAKKKERKKERRKEKKKKGFPGGALVKNPPANAGDTGSSPGLGRSHMLRSN